jgi:hypothetical protein
MQGPFPNVNYMINQWTFQAWLSFQAKMHLNDATGQEIAPLKCKPALYCCVVKGRARAAQLGGTRRGGL